MLAKRKYLFSIFIFSLCLLGALNPPPNLVDIDSTVESLSKMIYSPTECGSNDVHVYKL